MYQVVEGLELKGEKCILYLLQMKIPCVKCILIKKLVFQ